jgi:hypothetical protein
LVDDVARRNAGIDWSYAVDGLLNALVARANEAGAKTNRRELTSSIICAVDAEQGLLEMVIKYRQLRVGAVKLAPPAQDNVIRVDRFGPGPRRARGDS